MTNLVELPVCAMCRVSAGSVSGFYARRDRSKFQCSISNAVMTERVRQVHQDSQLSYGMPHGRAELMDQGVCISRQRISRINQAYLDAGKLNVQVLDRGFAWLDTGTHDSLLTASPFIETIESRRGFKVACLKEIAFNQGVISGEDVGLISERMGNTNTVII